MVGFAATALCYDLQLLGDTRQITAVMPTRKNAAECFLVSSPQVLDAIHSPLLGNWAINSGDRTQQGTTSDPRRSVEPDRPATWMP
jgi:hypothetical protein